MKYLTVFTFQVKSSTEGYFPKEILIPHDNKIMSVSEYNPIPTRILADLAKNGDMGELEIILLNSQTFLNQ